MKWVKVGGIKMADGYFYSLCLGESTRDDYYAIEGCHEKQVRGCGNETIMKRAQELRTKLKSVGLL